MNGFRVKKGKWTQCRYRLKLRPKCTIITHKRMQQYVRTLDRGSRRWTDMKISVAFTMHATVSICLFLRSSTFLQVKVAYFFNFRNL